MHFQMVEQLSNFSYSYSSCESIISNSMDAFSLRTSSACSLVYPHSGHGVLTVKNKSFTLANNRMYFLPMDATNCISSYEGCVTQIRFFVHSENPLRLVQIESPWDIFLPQAELILEMCKQIEACAREKPLGTLKASCKFHELLYLLYSQTLSTSGDHSIEQAVDYINQHYHGSLTREKLASLAGLNIDYFTKAFKKKMGVPPMTYITKVRIEKLKQLLLTTDKPLRLLCKETGFADEFYCSRRFKQTTGYSPKQYATVHRKHQK
ncbi:AraC family transcriptional regulator [Aureibacillus halotolerans]|uniref:Helix-turn-helix protein n=1 Tax=Aureibacillus halotolerans TaxID=1508390 RepID=A0A4R6TSH4_9BACI|nr:AraC family transcriptional regulator [Aureibacillus halotolerans]TDQ36570.1 helix-turn-helix protein [Aureibacillus halotolerans]